MHEAVVRCVALLGALGDASGTNYRHTDSNEIQNYTLYTYNECAGLSSNGLLRVFSRQGMPGRVERRP